MREVFIKTNHKKEYANYNELNKEMYVGIENMDRRYFMICAPDRYMAVRPGGWNEVHLSDRFFVFDTKKGLFDWMCERDD